MRLNNATRWIVTVGLLLAFTIWYWHGVLTRTCS